MGLHIGQTIKKTAKSKGIGATELARLINKSRPNVNDIFTRKTIDLDLLYSISKALNYDFFALYSEELKAEAGVEYAMTQHNEIDILKQKLELQTNNAVMQQKYITLLEEKVESFQNKIKELKEVGK